MNKFSILIIAILFSLALARHSPDEWKSKIIY